MPTPPAATAAARAEDNTSRGQDVEEHFSEGGETVGERRRRELSDAGSGPGT